MPSTFQVGYRMRHEEEEVNGEEAHEYRQWIWRSVTKKKKKKKHEP